MLKPELQVKFLQHLHSRKNKKDEGFTLIELLVVVIIIGVLAAIALPSLLNQVNKARQSEAKQNVGAMNRAQQAYYLENSNTFTTQLINLALGIKSQSENYVFDIKETSGTSLGELVTNKGRARAAKLKSYAGVVFTEVQTVDGIAESLTRATMCEANTPLLSTTDAGEAVAEGTATGVCPTGLKTVK